MPILESFDPPAFQDDFGSGEEALRQQFRAAWNDRLFCYFETAIAGGAWRSLNDSPRAQFFNPVVTTTPNPVVTGDFHEWTAFPNRLFDPGQTQEDRWRQGDEGPDNPNHGPSGPRGWQDEYCEWSVERNGDGKITRVTFTAENREYWETLWSVSREKVVTLYQEFVDPSIREADLVARDENGDLVLDDAGRPMYEPRNVWNSETTGRRAMHLVSQPNNLFAEVFLAGGASIVRETGEGLIDDQDELIECGSFGAPGRNSDPSIGNYVNRFVRENGLRVSLANPVGLYLGALNTTGFVLPSGTPAGVDPVDFWTIERGDAEHTLRASYSVPANLGYEVGDIAIDGNLIKFGAQLAERLKVKLRGIVFSDGQPVTRMDCVAERPTPLLQALFSVPERIPSHLQDFPLRVVTFNSRTAQSVRLTDPGIAATVTNVSPVPVGGNVRQLIEVTLNGLASQRHIGIAITDTRGEEAPVTPCVLTLDDELMLIASTPGNAVERMARDSRVVTHLRAIG